MDKQDRILLQHEEDNLPDSCQGDKDKELEDNQQEGNGEGNGGKEQHRVEEDKRGSGPVHSSQVGSHDRVVGSLDLEDNDRVEEHHVEAMGLVYQVAREEPLEVVVATEGLREGVAANVLVDLVEVVVANVLGLEEVVATQEEVHAEDDQEEAARILEEPGEGQVDDLEEDQRDSEEVQVEDEQHRGDQQGKKEHHEKVVDLGEVELEEEDHLYHLVLEMI